MIEALLKGISLGLALALMIGPVFFAMLETSISRGVRAGIVMALGVASSDTLYIVIDYNLISYLSNSSKMDTHWFNIGLGLVGGLIMLIFGLTSFLKKGKKTPVNQNNHLNKREILSFFTTGFVLNSINPFVLIFWIAPVSAVVSAKAALTIDLLFFVGVIGTVISTDFLKVYLAQKLNTFLSENMLTWLNRISGIALMGFGVRLLYFAFTEWTAA
jgi:threonine/homoserine/homoserine lactone efflux protein